MSVRAVAARIIAADAAGIMAADFSAVHTDSLLQRSRWQPLPAAAQRF